MISENEIKSVILMTNTPYDMNQSFLSNNNDMKNYAAFCKAVTSMD